MTPNPNKGGDAVSSATLEGATIRLAAAAEDLSAVMDMRQVLAEAAHAKASTPDADEAFLHLATSEQLVRDAADKAMLAARFAEDAARGGEDPVEVWTRAGALKLERIAMLQRAAGLDVPMPEPYEPPDGPVSSTAKAVLQLVEAVRGVVTGHAGNPFAGVDLTSVQ